MTADDGDRPQPRRAATSQPTLAAVVAGALLVGLLGLAVIQAPRRPPTATVAPIATPASPRPGATSASAGILGQNDGYGTGIGMDALNNTHIGGPDSITSSYRFRATTTSGLVSIRLYITDGTGYADGDGGTMDISVQPDDATTAHAPSGEVLASTSIRPGNPIAIGQLPLVMFPTPPVLTAGQLYHVVFRNTDASPTLNFVSLDGIYMFEPTTPRQLRFSDVDWGQPTRRGSGRWADQRRTVPILQLNYADGTVFGEGHIQVWVGSPKPISGPARAREAFVVSGESRLVSSVAVRLTRVGGSGGLTVRLETSDGGLIEEGTVPSASIPIGIAGSHDGPGQASWVTYQFSTPRLLTTGQGYNLVVSAPSDSTYSIFVLRKGRDYGFHPATFFGDGRAQYDPGTGWMFFDQTGGTPNLDQGDLQFWFR